MGMTRISLPTTQQQPQAAPIQQQISPRGSGPSKEFMNLNRKQHRSSSRQASQRSNRRNKYPEQYNALGGGAHVGSTVDSVTMSASMVSQQYGQPHSKIAAPSSSDIQVLPQIGGGNSAIPAPNGFVGLAVASKRSGGPQLTSMNGVLGSASFQSYTGPDSVNPNHFTSSEEHNFCAVMSIRGLKPGNPNWTNQDNFFCIENFDGRDIRLYSVFDGHGENGHLVSRRIREVFPQIIKQCNLDMDHAFAAMQNDLNNCDFDVKCSGATAVVTCVITGKIFVYNCGDSRAVLGRRNPNGSIGAHALSNDHKPDRADERKRVLSCGGHLGCRQVLVNQGRGPVSVPVGPCRVWYQHRGETLGLAMSRSLGDSVVHKCGVSAEPELIEHVIDEYDEFYIVATDGVWDVVDNNQAVQMVWNFASRSVNWNPLEAANCITKFARGRWEKLSPMIDDITCIVIKLRR
jgi:serine/threonine protein phosphatase PrpC